MAEIDPIAEPLLAGLLISPMASYGRAASERIAEDDGLVETRFEFPAGPRAAQQRRRARAERQVKAIDAVVQNGLRRELALTERLRELATKLNIRTIEVLPPDSAGAPATTSRVDHLLDEGRADAIRTFLAIWEEAVTETRQRIEQEL